MVGPARPSFVLFGSSIVQLSYSHGGWGAILTDIYARKADIALRGYNGWNSRRALQVINQIFPKSLSEKTRIIFLSCPPINEEKLREASLLAGLTRTNESCQKYSEACIDLCREMDLKVVDLFAAIQKKDNWMNICFIADGVHLSAEGSKIVVEEILKVLKEAEWEPSLHWKALPSEFAEDSPYDPPILPNGDTMNFADWTLYREIQWN